MGICTTLTGPLSFIVLALPCSVSGTMSDPVVVGALSAGDNWLRSVGMGMGCEPVVEGNAPVATGKWPVRPRIIGEGDAFVPVCIGACPNPGDLSAGCFPLKVGKTPVALAGETLLVGVAGR